ncbi:hypothetical protein SPWS13_1376 [Shewanella putrefaciens]|nr:hypothetical protein SPWS13_1376 [Shewanella putrefaciens]
MNVSGAFWGTFYINIINDGCGLWAMGAFFVYRDKIPLKF